MTRRQTIISGTAAAVLPITTEAKAMTTDLTTDFTLRPAGARGMADHGWLKSAHSFSFASYFDPNHVQFESLRVINDDRVAPGAGFPAHPHQNAEIFSYVLDGALEHQDSLGNGSRVKAGGVQYMSAGSGVRHSEYNPSPDYPVHFLQIWLMPNVENEAPRYDTLDIADADKDGKLALFLSADGRDGSMKISAHADIYAATLDGDQVIKTSITPGHKGWVQMARGSLSVNGQRLSVGDGLAINSAGSLAFSDGEGAEFILFDLAPYGRA